MLAPAVGFAAAPGASAGETVSLEAGSVRLTVDRASADVTSLTVGGIEMLARRSSQFMVRLTDPAARSSRWLDHGKAGSTRVEKRTNAIVVRSRFEAEALTVVVTWRADHRLGGIGVSARAGPAPGLIVESLTVPLLKLAASLHGDPTSTRLFMPFGDGCLATHEGMVKNPWIGRGYPGHASMQFMAMYGDRAGLTVQCRDAQARPKSFEAPYEASTDSVEMRIVHDGAFEPGRGLTTPETFLLTCGSSWESAAEQYRQWARKQWWARPKRGSNAPPLWLNESFLTVGGHLRPFGNGKLPVPHDRWPEVARSVKEAFGVPGVLLDLREWEHSGIYTSPFYFPLYPSDDAVRLLLDTARAVNARATAMVAGLQWMIEREAYTTSTYNVTAFDGRDRFEREGRSVCVVNRDGAVQVDAPYFTWDGSKARMCPAHRFTQAHFRSTALRLAQAGFAMFEFDQMNGGHCPPCYSRDHGHPPGPGAWMRKAIARFMADVRRTGRSVSPEFAVGIEDPSEVYLPYLDAYISRAAHTYEWPANGPGTEVVPAFAYVYNPLARPLCIDVQHSVEPNPYQLLLTARAFAGGCAPSTNLGLFSILGKYGEEDLFPTPGKLDPDQRKLLASIAAARSGPLLRFVTEGEMVAAPQPPVEPIQWRFRVWEKDHLEERLLPHPPVVVRAWRLPNGDTAYAFVNPTSLPVRFAYPLAEPVAPGGRSEIVVEPLSTLTVVVSPD